MQVLCEWNGVLHEHPEKVGMAVDIRLKAPCCGDTGYWAIADKSLCCLIHLSLNLLKMREELA